MLHRAWGKGLRKRALRKLSAVSRLRGYVPALVMLAVSAGLTAVFVRLFGQSFPGAFFVLLITLLGAAWCGYGPGVLVTVLIVAVVPYLYRPGFSIAAVSLGGLGVLLLVSLIVSWISAERVRSEKALMAVNENLERRVRERTALLERANAALRDSLAELETLYGKLSFGVAFLNPDLTFARLNEELAAVTGRPAAAHLGRRMGELLPAGLAEPLEAICRQVLETGDAVLEHRARGVSARDAGEEREWLIACAPVRVEDGAVRGVQLILQDITDRQRFEERLHHMAKLESLGVLAGGIAHDFNNLLTGILGNSSLAQEIVPPEHPAQSMLADVITASERASDLTRQLLAYAGKGRFLIEPIDLSALVKETHALIATAVEQRAGIQLDLADSIPPVAADPSQLQQIVMNLVINAAEAIPAGQNGIVAVRTAEVEVDPDVLRNARFIVGEDLSPGRYVSLEVRDNGSGMDAATLGRIFDPFFTTKFTGRGLGLAAVLGIVKGHHGALAVDSVPGQGTAFRILLPAAARRQRETAPPPRPPVRRTGAFVLVVDDDDLVLRLAKGSLEQNNYRVLAAPDGAEALLLFERFSRDISVVVLDLAMPNMSGEETLQRLKQLDPDVPVILSSGYDESDVLRRFPKLQIAGFLQKPYTAATLADTVATVLDQVTAA